MSPGKEFHNGTTLTKKEDLKLTVRANKMSIDWSW